MRNFPALLAAALLAACGSEQSDTVTGADGEQVVIRSGEAASASLPLGFTIYPGAAVVSNSTIATNDGEGSVLYMTTSASREQVAAHYRRQAEAAGIAISMETTNNTAHTIAGEGPGGKNFMMTASATAAGTGVQLMVGQTPGG